MKRAHDIPRIEAFLCATVHAADARQTLEQILQGRLLNSRRIVEVGGKTIAVFASLRECLEAAISLGSGRGARPAAIAVAVGESLPGCEPASFAARVAAELASLAAEGQILLARSAHEAARGALPRGYVSKPLGHVPLSCGLAHEQVSELREVGSTYEFPSLPGLNEVIVRLPDVPSPFVGRDREMQEGRAALREGRTLTLVGPGGIGKTALAAWIASDFAPDFRSGARWVDFGWLVAGESASDHLAAVVGVPGGAGHDGRHHLLEALSASEMLLVLDGCDEFKPQLRKLVPEILALCPEVSVLVTSREPLGFLGETCQAVPPLAVPAPHRGNWHASESLRLFASELGRSLNERELPFAADICRLCDGVPLALQLAAGKAASVGVEQVAANLRHSMDILERDHGPEAHRSMDQVVAWSIGALPRPEYRLILRLSVLAGTWREPFAAKVCAGRWLSEAQAREALRSLAARRLVHPVSDGSPIPRYRLLTPVKSVARSLLDCYEPSSSLDAKYAHESREWLMAAKRAGGGSEARLFEQIAQEYPHVRHALRWHASHASYTQALALFGDLVMFWLKRGRHADALEVAHELARRRGGTLVQRAQALHLAGTFAGYAGRYAEAMEHFQAALAAWDRARDVAGRVKTLSNMGIHLRNIGDVSGALRAFEAAAPDLPRCPEETQRAMLTNYATCLAELGRLEESEGVLAQLEQTVDAGRHEWSLAANHYCRSLIAIARGDSETGAAELLASMRRYRWVGDWQGFISTAERLGLLALRMGDYRRAGRLLGAAQGRAAEYGISRPPDVRLAVEEALEEVGRALGEEQAGQEVDRGGSLDPDSIQQDAEHLAQNTLAFSV